MISQDKLQENNPPKTSKLKVGYKVSAEAESSLTFSPQTAIGALNSPARKQQQGLSRARPVQLQHPVPLWGQDGPGQDACPWTQGWEATIVELENSPIATPLKKRANAPSVGLNRASGTMAGV